MIDGEVEGEGTTFSAKHEATIAVLMALRRAYCDNV